MLVHTEILLEIPSHLQHETACACWYFTPVITYQGWVVWHISAYQVNSITLQHNHFFLNICLGAYKSNILLVR